MIPRRLLVRNFMSYGDPGAELDFNFHTACLSGNNGEGKSALLDAITWALWGKARSDRLAAEDVIRLTPDDQEAVEARVDFEFEVSGFTYKVTRKRHRRRGASLELLVRDPADGDFRPLTGHTQKDTQTVINGLLRMDYETFLNSSFLAQGRADEFTRQSPAKRKELLAEILDLGRYQDMQDRAREHARSASARAEHEKAEIARIERELEQEPAERERLAALQAAADTAQKQAQQAQQALDQAQKILAQLEQDARQLDKVKSERSRLASEVQRLQGQIRSFQQRIAEHDKVLGRKREILEALGLLEKARALLAELDAKQQAAATIDKQRTSALHEIQLQRQRLQGELQAVERRIAELASQAAAIASLEAEQARLKASIEALEKAAAEAEQIAAHLNEAREQLAALSTREQQIASQQTAIEQKLGLLTQAGAVCPLCKQALTEHSRQQLLEEMTGDREALVAEHRGATDKGQAIERARSADEQRQKALQAQTKTLAAAHRQMGDLQRRLAGAREAQQQAARLADERDRLKARLESGDYAPEARSLAQRLEKEAEELGYRADEHEAARQRLAELSQFDRDAQALRMAEESLPKDAAHLEGLEAALASANEAAARAEKEQGELERRVSGLEQSRAEVGKLRRDYDAAQQERTKAAEELAACRQRLETLERLAQDLEGRRAELRASEHDQVIWADLAQAYGKEGIQALVIENMVPQLEEQANELLDRLTDGRMKVAIRTVKPLKSRDEKAETLEIAVSDELGERKYECYSGGEAFRIDFALRIALARLLAQRAGAKLQTLIIDEGFGTQDAAAREKLIEAINAIQPDFEKILVVTHVEEMKESFEHRIVVTKGPQGSQIHQVTA
jgi:exonuclease SbcC